MTPRPSPSSWWRLWAVQASWGPAAMQGLGMAVAGLPWLRRSRLDSAARREWLSQQLEFRNTNPYLAGLALGAGLRFREQAAPAQAQRFEAGLDRAVGALGDALVWGGLWPGFGALAACGAWLLGTPAAMTAWAAFAVLQAWIRSEGLRRGYAAGSDVLELLEHPRARRAVSLARGGALSAVGLLAGALVATLVRGGLALPAPGAWLCACVGAAAVGVLVAVRSWPPDAGAALVLAAAWAGARAWQLLG